MPNVQVFAWCTLSAVIGFIGGQLSPLDYGKKPPATANSPPSPAREAAAPVQRAPLLGSFRLAGFGPHGGVRLGRVTPGSLPELLGLKTGDEIIALNGFRIADPQQALQAYARLPHVDSWVVSLHRGGAPTEFRYAIR